MPLQDRVGLQPDRVPEALGFEQDHQLGESERGIAPEELGDLQLSVAGDNRQQDPPPELGAVVVAAPEQDPLQVAELVIESQKSNAR